MRKLQINESIGVSGVYFYILEATLQMSQSFFWFSQLFLVIVVHCGFLFSKNEEINLGFEYL